MSIDIATIPRGRHTVFATGRDATYTVWQVTSFTTRPNMVVVLVDDMDAMPMSLWAALPRTKQEIGDRGTTFTNAYAPDPICCPARATLLTGKYAHNTGVLGLSNDGGYSLFASSGAQNDTVATRLRAAGYRTAFAGKYLNGYEVDPSAVPPGWDEWFGLASDILRGYNYSANHNGVMKSYGTAPSDYQTDVLATEAVSFVNSTEGNDNQPFFMFVAPVAPHQWIPPAPRHASNPFISSPLPRHPNYDEADVTDKPEWLRLGVPQLGDAASADLENDYRRMLGSLLAVDDMVASIVSALKRNGEYDSTTLVFVSDNGFNFGAHRLDRKMAPYEESIRVPFVMAGPGISRRAEPAMATQLDLAPTLLDFAGIAIPDTVDGRSLRPLFTGSPAQWRSDLLLEFSGLYHLFFQRDTLAQVRSVIAAGGEMLVPTYRALRTERYLYVEWYGGDEHEYELYDIVADPWELSNLLAPPGGAEQYSALTAQLQARLTALAACRGSSCR